MAVGFKNSISPKEIKIAGNQYEAVAAVGCLPVPGCTRRVVVVISIYVPPKMLVKT